MKRYLPFMMLLVCVITSAQNIDDVLRYSIEDLQGTARFQSMGGAFGALGGDLSSLNINPAGSAVFNNNLITVTGTSYNRSNTVEYGGNTVTSDPSDSSINQAGGVLVFKNNNENSGWHKFAIAFNYEIVENFDDQFTASGTSNEGIDNYFLNFAQGVPFNNITLQDGEFIEDAYLDIGAIQGFGDQQAFLGFFGGIIDPATTDPNNTTYNSNATYTTVDQEYFRVTSGYNSKFTFNASSQYKDKLYVGASLNFHDVLYDRLDLFTETGYDPDSEIQQTTFDNRLRTEGAGFSLNVGAIAKLNNIIRIGASYQSPTWYRLTDDFAQRINSDLADVDINFINFGVVNLFESYTVKTPSKLTGSLALVFGKNGLLSFDYSYQDMAEANLSPDSDFAVTNDNIDAQLGAVSSLRFGGEFRIRKVVSVRGGYRYEGSPFQNGNTIGDLEGYSGGLGFNFGVSKLDLSVNRTERDIAESLFNTGITAPAAINAVSTNVTLSYTLHF